MGLPCGGAALRTLGEIAKSVGLPPVTTDLPVRSGDDSEAPLPDIGLLGVGPQMIVAVDAMHLVHSSGLRGETLSAFSARTAQWICAMGSGAVVFLVADASATDDFPRETVPSPLKEATRRTRELERIRFQISDGAKALDEWEAADPFPGADARDSEVLAWLDRSFAERRELLISTRFQLLLAVYLATVAEMVRQSTRENQAGGQPPTVYFRGADNVYAHVCGPAVAGVAACAASVRGDIDGGSVAMAAEGWNDIVYVPRPATDDGDMGGASLESDHELPRVVKSIRHVSKMAWLAGDTGQPAYHEYAVVIVDKDRDTFIACAGLAMVCAQVLHVMMYRQKRRAADGQESEAQEVTAMQRVLDVVSMQDASETAASVFERFAGVAFVTTWGGCDYKYMAQNAPEAEVIANLYRAVLGEGQAAIRAVIDATRRRIENPAALRKSAHDVAGTEHCAGGADLMMAWLKKSATGNSHTADQAPLRRRQKRPTGVEAADIALGLEGNTPDEILASLRGYIIATRTPGPFLKVALSGGSAPPRVQICDRAWSVLRPVVGNIDTATASVAAACALEFMMGTDTAGNSIAVQSRYPIRDIPMPDVASTARSYAVMVYGPDPAAWPTPLPRALARALSKK